MSKSFKDIVRGNFKRNPENPEPQKGSFGTNPSDPWSTKANISEDSALEKYLSSKGINPKFLSRDTKIHHAKSPEFISWKRNHMFEDMTKSRDSGDSRSLQIHSPTAQRQRELDKSSKHYEIKPVTTHIKKEEYISKNIKLVKVLEDKYQDGMAATQTVGMEVESNSKQRIKSARMIKALYKKHRMSEDMHDVEKEDKSIQTYGKKPKLEKADKETAIGEKKPQAAAVLSGGTTLTGAKRDEIEIDPAMRNRPGQPDITKKDKDKDKKDDKKKENK
jgi:hypothetical protein